jgi:hypothetical protein
VTEQETSATDRVWVVTPPSPRISPPLAIFDAHDREELCRGYEEQGWTVRGPYVIKYEFVP